jgi:hypothetical protein
MFRSILNIVLPHFFVKESIPPITHPDLLQAIATVKRCTTVEDAMQTALEIIAGRYQSKRFETYFYFHKMYEKDPNVLWDRRGFMHCTHQNYLFRVLLIKSGWLTEADIKLGFSLVWNVSPHQFLKVSLPPGLVAVDPWNFQYGIPMGEYATGFGSKKL